MKSLMLHLIFGSFILSQTPVALARCSRGSGWEPELWEPQGQIKKPWARLCCCHGLCHPNTTWVCAMGACPVRSPWMAPASSFQSAPPVLAKFCPEKHHGSHVPWAVLTLWIAQFSQIPSASSSQQSQGDPGRCPWLWFGWWCLLHALHTDNSDKIPLISWFRLIRNECNFSCNF